MNQAFDAITRTIWDLDTRPEPYEDPQHPYAVVINDGDEEDDLSTLEMLLRHRHFVFFLGWSMLYRTAGLLYGGNIGFLITHLRNG